MHHSKLKFLITTRLYDYLEASFFRKYSDTIAYSRLDGDNESTKINQEINLIIDASMDDIAGDFVPEHRTKIAECLKSMDHRTYLWLHLTINIIQQSPCEYGRLSDVENLLSELPAEISEAYETILSRRKKENDTEILLQIILQRKSHILIYTYGLCPCITIELNQLNLPYSLCQTSLFNMKERMRAMRTMRAMRVMMIMSLDENFMRMIL